MKSRASNSNLKYVFMAILIIIIVAVSYLLFFNSSNEILVNGSTTVYPIVVKAADEYMAKNNSHLIMVEKTSSGEGIRSLIEREIDIALSSREIKNEEIILAGEKNRHIERTSIGIDAISIIVHKDNPIDNLNLSEIGSIFFESDNGIESWDYFGDFGLGEINAYGPDPSVSGTGAFFEEKANTKKSGLAYETVFPSPEVISIVAEDPNAIGFVSYRHSINNPLIKIISINELSPSSRKSVINLDYPLARYLFVVYLRNPKDGVIDFVNFMSDPEGQKIVEEVGFIAVS